MIAAAISVKTMMLVDIVLRITLVIMAFHLHSGYCTVNQEDNGDSSGRRECRYYIHRCGKSWIDAQDSCKDIGASISTVDSMELQIILETKMKTNFWIGNNFENILQWEDGAGDSAEYLTNGKDKYPYFEDDFNEKYADNCVYIKQGEDHDGLGKWTTANCSVPLPFVCCFKTECGITTALNEGKNLAHSVPWHAHMESFDLNSHFSGTIIGHDTIIAHSNYLRVISESKNLKVWVGANELPVNSDDDGQELKVDSIIVHRGYDYDTSPFDYVIGLIKLKHEIKMVNGTNRVCLPPHTTWCPPTNDLNENSGFTLSYPSFDTDRNPILKKASIQLLSRSECQQIAHERHHKYITEDKDCYLAPDGTNLLRSASGGSVTYYDGKKHTLVGTIIGKIDSADGTSVNEIIVLAVRVNYHLEWIKEKIEEECN